MRAPTIHSNGTPADALFEQVCEVCQQLRRALACIQAAAPNGRDYYPQGDAALREASHEHAERAARVRAVLGEYEALAEAIADARDARRGR